MNAGDRAGSLSFAPEAIQNITDNAMQAKPTRRMITGNRVESLCTDAVRLTGWYKHSTLVPLRPSGPASKRSPPAPYAAPARQPRRIIIPVQAPAVLAHSAQAPRYAGIAGTATRLQNRRSRGRGLPPPPD